VIEEQAVPVYAETRALCQALHLDPWGLIASGALLMAVDAACADHIARALEAQGIRAAVIGRVTGQAGQVLLRDAVTGRTRNVPCFERDEIARLFEG
jgi:hydrogenase maturation factor